MLDELANDSLALNIELSMYTCVDNLDYDSVRRVNPCTQTLLVDLKHRLDQAGSLSEPSRGQASPSPRQRELAVCTARLVMALTSYMVQSGQHSVGQSLPPAKQQALTQQFQHNKQQLLNRLYRYVRCGSGRR